MKKNIILDFDSTVVKIEGVDELARIKGRYKEVVELTNQAMNGEVSIEDIFAKRLEIINPTKEDLTWLEKLYLENLVQGIKEFISGVMKNHNVFVVSGGYKKAVLLTTRYLGIPDENVYANELIFDERDNYVGFDRNIPLWKKGGKSNIVKKILDLFPGKTIIIGDGASDAEAKTYCEEFVQFAGVVNREKVSKLASYTVHDFSEIII